MPRPNSSSYTTLWIIIATVLISLLLAWGPDIFGGSSPASKQLESTRPSPSCTYDDYSGTSSCAYPEESTQDEDLPLAPYTVEFN